MIIPFTTPIMVAVLAFIFANGGSFGEYTVIKDDGVYRSNFESRLHEVLSVVDGDTFVLASAEGKSGADEEVRVRLLGINAPELGSCYGAESKKELQRLLLGEQIVLDRDEVGSDGYGRVLRYAFVNSGHPELDTVFVTAELVRRGAARAQYVPPNKRYAQRISAAEKEAYDAKRGLWAGCEYARQSDTRREDREVASESFSRECVIKGNIAKKKRGMKEAPKDYFVPGCPNYKRVKVDTSRGEKWFCSEKDAQEAGWGISKGCGNLKRP